MTSHASVFIVVFTVVNILACVWLMWWTARSKTISDIKPPETAGEVTGHVWDGDLEEYNNPLPRWWLWLFIITIVFGAAYLIVFPGLGNFDGVRGWNQIAQYEQQIEASRAKLEARLAQLNEKPLHELASDATAMATARNLFSANCSTCHGSDARGAKGFPNLTDADWLWGGTPETIQASIASGRHGVMPALGTALGQNGVNEVASYVVSLSGGKAPADWVAAGKQRFEMLCTACHGADGRGNQILGAPNLTDEVWLHGRDFASIQATITNGRNNQMPAHLEMLGDAKVKLLAAYVMSLGGADVAMPRDHGTSTAEAKPITGSAEADHSEAADES